ncbi:ABC transporter ATP-binding protein [Desulforegula conservatrix]|uniref:ABC transporter ATP-binding protein n=1 Tax=Desulforegula conservatrix TaxID=153026 RepID=UPI00041C4778|nr:dipeptide ABC transporter ATP-binding protein [Desulforegula conservatrix]
MNENRLLKIENLGVSFISGQNKVEAVKGISFEIMQGETFALAGESGSGKSATAHSILRLLPTYAFFSKESRITFRDKDLSKASEAEMRKIRGDRISMIFQEPLSALNPLHKIGRQIEEMLLIHQGIKGKKAKDRVIELLDLTGIPDPDKKITNYPHQLSGGQRQRVMIAMALANNPELLIADEPTTALDVTVQAQILCLIKDLQKKFGMAVLFISHDLDILKNFSDRIAVMKDGQIVESGKTSDIFREQSHEYTKSLITTEISFQKKETQENAKEVLKVKDLDVDFDTGGSFFGFKKEKFQAVSKASFSIKKGCTLGIAGESGSGKSSLALALLRLIKSSGSIELDEKNIEKMDQKTLRPLRKKMQVVFQDPFASLSPRMTAGEIVGEGLGLLTPKPSKEKKEEMIIKALSEVGLDPAMRHRYPHEFSGGQRQRIAIARAIILRPELMIFDEPTSSLDRAVQFQVLDLLVKLQEEYNLAYIFISHDLKVLKAISHDILIMKSGQIVESGKTQEVFANPATDYSKNLIKAAFF